MKTRFYAAAIRSLVPGADFSIRAFPNTDSERADPNFKPVIDWRGPGQAPSESEILAEVLVIEAAEAAKISNIAQKNDAARSAREALRQVDVNALDMSPAGLRSMLQKIITILGT